MPRSLPSRSASSARDRRASKNSTAFASSQVRSPTWRAAARALAETRRGCSCPHRCRPRGARAQPRPRRDAPAPVSLAQVENAGPRDAMHGGLAFDLEPAQERSASPCSRAARRARGLGKTHVFESPRTRSRTARAFGDKRDDVRLALLHAARRNGPRLAVRRELVPTHPEHFGGACRRQRRKLESARRRARQRCAPAATAPAARHKGARAECDPLPAPFFAPAWRNAARTLAAGLALTRSRSKASS